MEKKLFRHNRELLRHILLVQIRYLFRQLSHIHEYVRCLLSLFFISELSQFRTPIRLCLVVYFCKYEEFSLSRNQIMSLCK